MSRANGATLESARGSSRLDRRKAHTKTVINGMSLHWERRFDLTPPPPDWRLTVRCSWSSSGRRRKEWDQEWRRSSLTEINDLRKQLKEVTAQLENSRTLPPPESEGFAQASDVMGFQLNAAISVKETDKQFRRELTQIVTATPTWDNIFSAVGPALLDEVTQRGMRPYLDAALTRSVQGHARRSVRQWAASNDIELEGVIRVEATLSEDDLATVLVQLRALGLITRSERRRSVTDKATYWTLTPYGDTHLIALRAISRDASGDPQHAGADNDKVTVADAAARNSEAAEDAPDPSQGTHAADADTPSTGKA